MVSKEMRNLVYKENKNIINFIYYAGNKVADKTLLKEICFKFNVVETESQYQKLVRNLIDYELVREEKFTISSNKIKKVLILKKGAIALVENKENSKSVAGVSSRVVSKRIKLSSLKMQCILKICKVDKIEVALNFFRYRLFISKNSFKDLAEVLEQTTEIMRKLEFYNEEELKKERSILTQNAKILTQNAKKSYENKKKNIKNNKILEKNSKGYSLEKSILNYQISNNCFLLKIYLKDEDDNTINSKVFNDIKLIKDIEKIEYRFVILLVSDYTKIETLIEIIVQAYDFYNNLYDTKSECAYYFKNKSEFTFEILSNSKNIKKELENNKTLEELCLSNSIRNNRIYSISLNVNLKYLEKIDEK